MQIHTLVSAIVTICFDFNENYSIRHKCRLLVKKASEYNYVHSLKIYVKIF